MSKPPAPTTAPTTSPAAAGPAPIIAHIALAPSDMRTLDQVCADYDVPAGLCALSRNCQSPDPRAASGARVVSLVLRPGTGGCAEAAAPR